MRRFVRLLLIVAVGGALLAGSLSTVAVAASNIWNTAGTATFASLAALGVSPAQPSVVYASDGTTVLGIFQGAVNRIPIQLSQAPPVLIRAVLDTEDERFYIHGGFDIPSTIRALATDSEKRSNVQGASTITQQLVKQTYLTSQKTLSRKIKEAVIASRLEEKYTKNQILTAYLNTIYFGNGAYGVQAAANEYFNEDVSKLTLSQSALLAGLIQNPNGDDPLLNPDAARIRRGQVLGRMQHYGDISKSSEAYANSTPLPTAVSRPVASEQDPIDNYYVQAIETQLLAAGSPLGSTYDQRYDNLFYGGLKIYANLNLTMQAEAEQAVIKETPRSRQGFQEALVSIDPTTGKVLAMVGGTGTNSQFNIVTQGTRQPGSGFKIFTLLAALAQGDSPYDSVLGSSPCAVDFPTDHDLLKQPAHNDEGNGGGVENLITATAQSTNCAFIRLAHEVTLPAVVAMAHALGITGNIPLFPSIVIGSYAVPPIEMAGAYATVADDGVYHRPTFIDHIVDRSGGTIFQGEAPGVQVFSAQVAREADLAFEQTLIDGTAAVSRLSGRQAAGKTGTTENYDDAWFNGYTPQLETTVWMGSLAGEISMDIPGHGAVFGADYPAHTWRLFMQQALTPYPVVAIPKPITSELPPTRYITLTGLTSAPPPPVQRKPTPPTPTPTTPTPTTPPAAGGPTTTALLRRTGLGAPPGRLA